MTDRTLATAGVPEQDYARVVERDGRLELYVRCQEYGRFPQRFDVAIPPAAAYVLWEALGKAFAGLGLEVLRRTPDGLGVPPGGGEEA